MVADGAVPSHWGESERNRERNGGSRNDRALLRLTGALLDGIVTQTYFVQTCGHRDTYVDQDTGEVISGICPSGDPDCGEVTSVFMGVSSRDFPTFDANILSWIARRHGVRAFIFVHGRYDEKGEGLVDIHSVKDHAKTPVMTGSWQDVATVLRAEQHEHEREKHSCSSQDQDWLFREDTIGKTRDLSLSNAIREIPGVRHTDIDATVACANCGRTVVLIESTSDGIKPRDGVRKSAHVVRAVGRRLFSSVFLIQHGINDVEHRESVVLTRWTTVGSTSIDHEEMPWAEAVLCVQEALDEHYEQRLCDALR